MVLKRVLSPMVFQNDALNKTKGSQGIPGKVSVVEGIYWNDLMHDDDFPLNGGTE